MQLKSIKTIQIIFTGFTQPELNMSPHEFKVEKIWKAWPGCVYSVFMSF